MKLKSPSINRKSGITKNSSIVFGKSLMRTLFALFLVSVLHLPQSLKAQTEYDALRFSQYAVTGTARSIGMGGAFTAVGGDITNISLNPAGLGLYSKSELGITVAPQFITANSDFLGSSNTSRTGNFGFPSIGLVIHGKTKGKRSLTSYSIGLGFNQFYHHKRRTEAEGFNNYNSVTNYFAEQNLGLRSNSSLLRDPNYQYDISEMGAMAYNSYFRTIQRLPGETIDTVSIVDVSRNTNTTGQWLAAFNYGKIQQGITRIEWGRNNEYGISFAGNFDDRFHIGATIGIPDVRYELQAQLSETDRNNIYNFNSLDTMRLNGVNFNENLITSGIGVNLQIGGIYQPIDALRIGASIKTPSVIGLTDRYNYNMAISGDDSREYSKNNTVDNEFEYTLYTPYQANFGAAGIIGKAAIVSVDFGITDYGMSSFGSAGTFSSSFFRNVNNQIRKAFKTSYNFRVGGEIRLKDIYIRAGYSYFSDPYSAEEGKYTDLSQPSVPTVNVTGEKHVFSAGVGYRTSRWYCDITLSQMRNKDKLMLYSLNTLPYNVQDNRSLISPTVITERIGTRLLISLGIFFGGSAEE